MSSQQQQHTSTMPQADNTDAASVATTSSFSSHIGLLKDKLHSSSTSKKDKDEQEQQKKKKDVLRNQIRMGF